MSAGGEPAAAGQEPAAESTHASGRPAAAKPSSGRPDAAKPSSGDRAARDTAASLEENPLLGQNEMFQTGLKYLGVGNTAFVESSRIADMQIGTRIINNYASGGGRLGAGPVRDSVMAWTRATYVPVDEYDDLLDLLRDLHVIVLRGRPGTGRSTTGLHLLDAVAPGQVARLPDDRTVEQVGEADVKKSWGYLLDTDGEALREMHLDRLGTILRERDAYCVVIVELDPLRSGTLGGYVRDHTQPGIRQTIAAHIRESLRDTGDSQLVARIQDLAEQPEIVQTLGPKPYTSEAVELAEALASHGLGKITYDEVLLRAGQVIERQVIDWFSCLRVPDAGPGATYEREVRISSLRIALAVYNDAPYDVAVEAAGKLADQLLDATATLRQRRRPTFAADRGSLLAELRCHRVEGMTWVDGVGVPSPHVLFDDDRYPYAILTYLWKNQDHHRPALIAWLKGLAEDLRTVVWVRAAQALGVLCPLDYGYVLENLVLPWADATDQNDRMAGAMVLALAASDERIRPAVVTQLHRWVRGGNDRLRWTAALAQSRQIGLLPVDETLDNLRIVGTWRAAHGLRSEDPDDPDLDEVASWSVALLFTNGAVRPVLTHLRAWLAEPRYGLRDLALWCVLQMMWVRSYNVWTTAGSGVPAQQRRWPLILTRIEQEPDLADDLADMVWQTLLGAPSEPAALWLLRRWIREAERDPACLTALESFLPLLVDSPHARERLAHLIRGMRVEWVDPLDAGTADRIEKAINRM